jgi:tetratricopeptide (TPR) repeat protein
MYARLGNIDQALESLETALSILRTNHGEMHHMVASCLHAIGSTYLQSKNIHDVSSIALEFLQKALNIRQKILPENDLSISTSFQNIGSLYRALGQFDEALTFFEHSLEVKLKSIPKSHPTIIENYRSLNTVYLEKGDHEKASKYTQLMAQSEVQSLILKEPDCIGIEIQLPGGSSEDSST